MAPQFEHSALTPPGAVFALAVVVTERKTLFVAVAPGLFERVLVPEVRTVSCGRPTGVFARPSWLPKKALSLLGAIVVGVEASAMGATLLRGDMKSAPLSLFSSSLSLLLSSEKLLLEEDVEEDEEEEEDEESVAWLCDETMV